MAPLRRPPIGRGALAALLALALLLAPGGAPWAKSSDVFSERCGDQGNGNGVGPPCPDALSLTIHKGEVVEFGARSPDGGPYARRKATRLRLETTARWDLSVETRVSAAPAGAAAETVRDALAVTPEADSGEGKALNLKVDYALAGLSGLPGGFYELAVTFRATSDEGEARVTARVYFDLTETLSLEIANGAVVSFGVLDPLRGPYVRAGATRLRVAGNAAWRLEVGKALIEHPAGVDPGAALDALSVAPARSQGAGADTVAVDYRLADLEGLPDGDYRYDVVFTVTAR